MTDLVASILVVTGVVFAIAGGLGLQHFPDVFARMHAATKPTTVGLLLVLTAAILRLETAGHAKLVLVMAFQLVTAPVAMHVLGRAAYWSGVDLSEQTWIDELGREDGDKAEG